VKKKNKFSRPKARKIPFELINDFLGKKGYEVIKIERLWRHITAVVEKDNKRLFFKMATTQKTGRLTENEFNWNKLVNSKLDKKTPFLIPQGIEHGFFQEKLFFFVSDYFGDRTLADKYPPRTKELSRWIFKIAQASFFINSIDCQVKDKEEIKTIGEFLMPSVLEWSSYIKVDVEPLLKIIKEAKQPVRRCWGHGDFVPWHMYDLKNKKFGLVDSEHGGCKIRYYDVAYFYTRIRQCLGEKELAKDFLLFFKDLLSDNDKKNFYNDLKPMLCQRLIGSYWEAEIGSKKDRKNKGKEYEEYKKDLIEDKII